MATQLSFALRTTSNVKTVHLIGSWDGYQGQLPLSRGSSSGSWKGTFRFQPSALQPGQRYWFYYMMDGYKVSHDPSKESVVEPTTGRTLNVLDVPKSKSRAKTKTKSHSPSRRVSSSSKRSSRRESREVPRGRALPEGAIACPMPMRPGQAAALIEQAHNQSKMDQLAWRLAHASLEEESEEEYDNDYYDDDDDDGDDGYGNYQDYGAYGDSPDGVDPADGGGAGDGVNGGGSNSQYGFISSDDDSDLPSLTIGSSRSSSSRGSGSSSPSSVSSACSCERYAVTRAGERIRLDCGGSICGSSDGGSGIGGCGKAGGGDGASTDEDSDSAAQQYRYRVKEHPDPKSSSRRSHLRDSRRVSRHHGSSRRHGMVMV